MSVVKRGDRYQVRYRLGGRESAQRSRTFARQKDALLFDADVKRRAALGSQLVAELDRHELTLRGYLDQHWIARAATLAPKTRAMYLWALEGHFADLLDEPLAAITAPALERHQQRMLARGASASTVREAMARLSGVLQTAAGHGFIPANPARVIRKVSVEPVPEIDPLAPVELERLLANLSSRDRAIVQLGGHLGLRPGELRKITWTGLSDGSVTVGRAQAKGHRGRVVNGPAVALRELREWQLQSGGRGDEPVIGDMTANALKLWGAKRLRPAIADATLGRLANAPKPVYLLRHSHASACHYVRDLTLPAILARLGHKQQAHFQHYAHVMDAVGEQRYATLDELVARSRAELADLDKAATR
jgi:integrase